MSLSFVAFVSCSDDKEKTSSNGGSSVYKSGIENGHEYVDLGLPSGTLWATCNVGAATPQDYGNHYAWGEVEPKDNYDWRTYKYGRETKLTKYCFDSEYGKDGFTDSKETLDLEDDAAYMNWGGNWRMPTHKQQLELSLKCYWLWTDNYNGSNAKGFIVYKAKTASDALLPVNGTPSSSYSLSDAHIFLPVKAHSYDYSGYYWSSSLDGTSNPHPDKAFALRLECSDNGIGSSVTICLERYEPIWVRAVIPGNK